MIKELPNASGDFVKADKKTPLKLRPRAAVFLHCSDYLFWLPKQLKQSGHPH